MSTDLKTMGIDELKEFAEKNNISLDKRIKNEDKIREVIEQGLTNRIIQEDTDIKEIEQVETKNIETEVEQEQITDENAELTEVEVEKELTVDQKIAKKDKEISDAKKLVEKLRIELSNLISEKNKTKRRPTIAELNKLSKGRRMSTDYLANEREKQLYLELHKKYGI